MNARILVAAALTLAGACAPSVPPASAAQRAQVRVTMYTTRWCPVCTRARSWMHARGIPFRDLDVESDVRAAVRHRALNPDRTVPTLDIEGEILVGFVANEVRRAIDRAAHRYPPQPPTSGGAAPAAEPAAPGAPADPPAPAEEPAPPGGEPTEEAEPTERADA